MKSKVNIKLRSVRETCLVELARISGESSKFSYFWDDDSAESLAYECQTNYEFELVKEAWYKANREK